MTEFQVLFLDVDDTLYPRDSGLWYAIRDRIQRYIEVKLNLSPTAGETLRQKFLNAYGTTLRGLQVEFEIDAIDYLEFVHDVPVQDFLKPDPDLRSLLQSLNVPVYFFTNAFHKHVERVLDALGIGDLGTGIIDICTLEYRNKPLPDAYTRALAIAGGPAPGSAVLVDDRRANLEPAAELGLFTVLVGPASDGFHPDRNIALITDLEDCLPELFQGKGR